LDSAALHGNRNAPRTLLLRIGIAPRRVPMNSLVLVVLLVVVLLAVLPAWPYSTGWGYYPSGIVGLIVVVLLIMALMGRI
jgi:hypothetical protein